MLPMEKIVIGSLLVAVRFFPRPNIPSNLVLREFAFHFSKTPTLAGQRLKLGTAVKSFWVALHVSAVPSRNVAPKLPEGYGR